MNLIIKCTTIKISHVEFRHASSSWEQSDQSKNFRSHDTLGSKCPLILPVFCQKHVTRVLNPLGCNNQGKNPDLDLAEMFCQDLKRVLIYKHPISIVDLQKFRVKWSKMHHP